MKPLPASVLTLAKAQFGVMTRRQLRSHGVSVETIRWNASRSWRVVLPCTYALTGVQRFGDVTVVGPSEVTERQRPTAALLLAGEGSALTGMTGAAVHGLTNAAPGGAVQVVVPASRSSRTVGFAQIRRSLLEDPEVVTRDGLRVSSLARCCVDACVSEADPRVRTALLVEAVQRNRTTVEELAQWCFRLRSRDIAKVLPSLDVAAEGVWSVAEADVLALMSGSAILPEVVTNPGLVATDGRRLLTPDLWLDDVAMAVMVHSRQYHSSGQQFVDTIERDGDLVAAGVVVIAVTPSGVRRDPAGALARIEATYAVAQQRPRPPVRALPRAA